MTETLANDQEMFETLKTQQQEAEAKQKREAADIQKKMLALEQSFPSYEALQNARSEEQQAKKVWEDLGKKYQRSHSIRKKAGIAALKRTAEAAGAGRGANEEKLGADISQRFRSRQSIMNICMKPFKRAGGDPGRKSERGLSMPGLRFNGPSGSGEAF